jgi:hypothetical protein
VTVALECVQVNWQSPVPAHVTIAPHTRDFSTVNVEPYRAVVVRVGTRVATIQHAAPNAAIIAATPAGMYSIICYKH